MKALDPPSNRFDKRLKNTRYELHVSNKDAKSNHILQIPIVKTTSLDTLSANSVIADNQKSIVLAEGGASISEEPKSRGLYSYGPPTIDTGSLLPTHTSSKGGNVISELIEPSRGSNKSPPRSPKKKENPLRPPAVDRGALALPTQQPPPPQPSGPVPAPALTSQGSQVFANRSTASLLGLDPSLSISAGPSTYLSQPSSLDHIIKVPSTVPLRPKLTSIDLLSEVADDIDNETRARTASYETFLERHSASFLSTGSLMHQNMSGKASFTAAASAAANTLDDSSALYPRPASASIQLFDFNKMVRMEAPPSPSALDRQQQELSVQMKLAYLNGPLGNTDDSIGQPGASGKSRPQSRTKTPGARPVSVPITTQVLRLPSALSHELSIYTEGSDTFNPHSSTDSFIKVPDLQESSLGLKVNLNMGSEIETSVVSNLHTASGDAQDFRVSLTVQTGPAVLDTDVSIAKNMSVEPVPMPLSPILQQLLPQQLQVLQQPHYQDARYQMNPREIVYKFHGHLLNTTPFPEEVAHLSLHTKNARLPQYLRAQQEEQQARYAAKLRKLSQAQKRPDKSLSPDARSPKNAAHDGPINSNTGETEIAPREIDFSEFVALETPTSPKRDSASMFKSASEPGFSNKDRSSLTAVAESGSAEQSPMPGAAAPATAEGNGPFENLRHVMSDELDTARVDGEIEVECDGSLAEGSQASILSHPHSRTSSPGDGLKRRSVSLRITSTGSMVEEITEAKDALQPESPHGSISSSLPSVVTSGAGSNRIAAGFAKAASGSNRASSPVAVPAEAPSAVAEQSSPALAVSGKNAAGHTKVKSTSPNRVAYVLNKSSPLHVGSADADDRSLHSIHSLHSLQSTGNYSAITDDANASALSYNVSVAPLTAQSPEYSRFASSPKASSKGASRFVPRLEGVFGESTSLVSESAESALPYQVHRKVMGWKLTSVQRRRNLVGMLDLVANSRANRNTGNSPTRKALTSKIAPPLQVPHALLRTGHGKRVRTRDVPPLRAVHKQMLSIQNDQRELQMTQVLHGFNYFKEPPPLTPMTQFNDSLDTPSLNRSLTVKINRQNSKKKVGSDKNPLSASTSNLAALAMQVEDMARYLPPDSRPTSPSDIY